MKKLPNHLNWIVTVGIIGTWGKSVCVEKIFLAHWEWNSLVMSAFQNHEIASVASYVSHVQKIGKKSSFFCQHYAVWKDGNFWHLSIEFLWLVIFYLILTFINNFLVLDNV